MTDIASGAGADVETDRASNLRKMDSEIAKLLAETSNLNAETRKIAAETRWYPLVFTATIFGAAATFVGALIGLMKLLLG